MYLSLMDLADETRPKDIAKSILKMLREQFEGRLPIPIPIEEIAILLEINNIIYQEFKSIDGMLLVNEDIGQIFVNSTLSNHRQRYTIGHELGHWLIPSHRLNSNNFKCSNSSMRLLDVNKDTTPIERIEIEANIFSCELLLPELEFKKDIRSYKEPCISQVLELAQIYNMSKLATARRYVTLNDHSCAIIQSHNFHVTHVYKHKDFPTLDTRKGYPLPPRSYSAKAHSSISKYSELLPIEWFNWLKSSPLDKSELYEQVLYQVDNYRLTLLFLDTTNCLDEEEIEDQGLELGEMSFRKRA